jgi:hypothetical protein
VRTAARDPPKSQYPAGEGRSVQQIKAKAVQKACVVSEGQIIQPRTTTVGQVESEISICSKNWKPLPLYPLIFQTGFMLFIIQNWTVHGFTAVNYLS